MGEEGDIDDAAQAHYLLEVESRALAVHREAWAMRIGLAPVDALFAARLGAEVRALGQDVEVLIRYRSRRRSWWRRVWDALRGE